jgi:hypothetical protein
LVAPEPDDRQRLKFFIDQVNLTWATVWAPGERFFTCVLVLLALAFWTVGRRLAERGLTWRASTACRKVACVAARWHSPRRWRLGTTAIALHLLFYACTRHEPLTPVLQTFRRIRKSRLRLRPDHRVEPRTAVDPASFMAAAGDGRSVALALRPYPRILAATLLVLVTLVQVSNATGMSSQIVIAQRGVIAIVVIVILVPLLLRVGKVRKALISANEPEAASTFAGAIYSIATVCMGVSALALLTGYVSLARFVTYELVWPIVLAGFYLLVQVVKDACEYLFSPRYSAGKTLKQTLGLGDRRLEQISIVLSGASRAGLLLLAVITLFVGGIGTTFGQLDQQCPGHSGWCWRKLNIVPAHLINAVLALLDRYLPDPRPAPLVDNEFLPKTDMDPACASLSTLFSNIGYATIMLTLSSLGVRWTNLAWIVSALSVGIGFGLQEIVKNFVSGLILHRAPGEGRRSDQHQRCRRRYPRINVRATEIQLRTAPS